jgi:YfiH family protein
MEIVIEQAKILSAIPGLRHGFFGRKGGQSVAPFSSLNCSYLVGDDPHCVAINRRRAMLSLKLDNHTLVMPKIVHGKNVLVVHDDQNLDELSFCEADAIITKNKKLCLAITYADCLAIVLAGSSGELIAAVHAGWRGILLNIIEECVRTIRKNFGELELRAALGPHISADGLSMLNPGLKAFQDQWPQAVYEREALFHVDLEKIAHEQLKRSGVNKIERVGTYTDKDPDRYFSYRSSQGHTGRNIALIALS